MVQSRPTVRQLECFAMIAETLSFNRAAQRLNLSQPTLTSQIVSLERSLGTQLFERSRSGTRLTMAGRELLPNACNVIEELHGVINQAASINQVSPTDLYRLGVNPALGPYLLPDVLPTLRSRYPTLQLCVREASARELEMGLASGKHDLILTESKLHKNRLVIAPLFRERMILIMPTDHRLARRKRIYRKDLVHEPILTIDKHPEYHRKIEDLSGRLGTQIRHDYKGTSLHSLRHMVSMGLGIAFMPALYLRSRAACPKDFHIAQLHGESIEQEYSLAWRTHSPASKLFEKIAEAIRTVALRDLGEEFHPSLRRAADEVTH